MKTIFETVNTISSGLEKEIRQLESVCNRADGTSYSLFLDNAYNADRSIDFIYLLRSESELISVAVLFFPDIKEFEFYGFTHPEYRKKGLFNRLIDLIHRQLKPLNEFHFLFVCDPRSKSGTAFLHHMGTELIETEYMMDLNRDDFELYLKDQKLSEENVKMREATLDDLPSISAIASLMYGEEQGSAEEFVTQRILSDKREQLVAIADKKIIGICTIGLEEGSVMINGLAIDKLLQGRGLGRDFLNRVIVYSFKKYQGPIKLEVSSVNDKAFNLYKSVGFIQRESYGYYRRITP